MIEFGPFRYDTEARLLYRGAEEIMLPPRVLAVLESLLKRPGKVATKDAVLESAWEGAFVGEDSLTQAVSQLRSALGDDPQRPTYIQTIPKRGYRFIAEVSEALVGQEPLPRPAEEAPVPPPAITAASTLAAGNTVGNYELLSQIGAGAMGEVWRARDTELQRDVAIKVVPQGLAGEAAVIERFRREALMLAAVNHPNIASIHGVEEVNGTPLIVMELLDGETLQERLRGGALSLEDALNIAIQIARALEVAHHAGIVHRDLKPGNIMLGAGNHVKVLDFGLAKDAESGDGSETVDPTLLTAAGLLVGTAAYMSPEQAAGKTIDKRSDIFSFGCVLFEMLAGERPFGGDTASEMVAAILKDAPDWSALPAATPPMIAGVLQRCLRKDPDRRVHDMADARIEIAEALDGPAFVHSGSIDVAAGNARRLPWAVAALAIAAAGLFASWAARPPQFAVRNFQISLPDGHTWPIIGGGSPFGLSPDGTRLVFAARGPDGVSRLYHRLLDAIEAEPIRGTEDARSPVFAPDNRRVAFVSEANTIYQVSLPDGEPLKVCDSPGLPLGLAWGPDDTIYFAASRGLLSCTVAGSGPTIAYGSARRLAWPQLLADDGIFLLTGRTAAGHEIVVLDLQAQKETVLLQGAAIGAARYLDTGHLVYARGGQLFAQPLDLERLQPLASATAVVADIYAPVVADHRAAYFDVSATGSLIYANRPVDRLGTQLLLVETGAGEPVESVVGEADGGRFAHPRVSPDGNRIAVDLIADDGTSAIRIYQLGRGVAEQSLRTGFDNTVFLAWTPDGSGIAFRAKVQESMGLFLKVVDDLAPPRLLFSSPGVVFPEDWHPDADRLAFDHAPAGPSSAESGFDTWILRMGETTTAAPLEMQSKNAVSARFAPGGRWLAYMSGDLGPSDVFVEPFPADGRREPISSGGGVEPVWSRDGSRLYYRAGDRIMVVDIESDVATDPELVIGASRIVLDGSYDRNAGRLHNFDVMPDGRLVMIRSDEARTRLNVRLGWAGGLR